jgi:hypothetical protein
MFTCPPACFAAGDTNLSLKTKYQARHSRLLAERGGSSGKIFIGTIGVDSVGIALSGVGPLNPLLASFIHVASERQIYLGDIGWMLSWPRLAEWGRRCISAQHRQIGQAEYRWGRAGYRVIVVAADVGQDEGIRRWITTE